MSRKILILFLYSLHSKIKILFPRGKREKELTCSVFCTIQYIATKLMFFYTAAAAAKSLQSCPPLCDPIDGSPPGSPVPGILQARPLEWGAISFSNLWKWKWSHSVMSDSYRPHGLQPTSLLCPWDFPGKSTGVGCHCLLQQVNLFLAKLSEAEFL